MPSSTSAIPYMVTTVTTLSTVFCSILIYYEHNACLDQGITWVPLPQHTLSTSRTHWPRHMPWDYATVRHSSIKQAEGLEDPTSCLEGCPELSCQADGTHAGSISKEHFEAMDPGGCS